MNEELSCWDCLHAKVEYDEYGYDLWCSLHLKDLESEGIEICDNFEEDVQEN